MRIINNRDLRGIGINKQGQRMGMDSLAHSSLNNPSPQNSQVQTHTFPIHNSVSFRLVLFLSGLKSRFSSFQFAENEKKKTEGVDNFSRVKIHQGS